ncbi:MAG: trypsin-like peptidase domain-containing protein, partial [Cocleimonas sp.]
MLNIMLKKIISSSILISLIMITHAVKAELPDFTKIVEQHSAAVVNISTKQNSKSDKRPPGLKGEQGEIFDELMKRFLDKDGARSSPDREASSLGSGFITSKDGYVVTNYHVIAQADEIIVRLSDRRELAAELVGIDKRSDVALLKVDANDLPVLETGSSANLKVGEWVVAIGSPFGFDHSV